MLIDSLKLVERTYLGASGTRGNGTVKFKGITARLYDVGGNLVNEIRVEDLDKFKEAALRLPLECRK
ncbi:MAG: type III-A CRISPR-associated RAMP protein Csm3, partial [Pyrobaculum aerophilum]|nr:type III-A CRISPR-associated RAMP protein Csm3 [Pyrobaculum aerophilum]